MKNRRSMANYKQITYRYLKGQRNRTLLTILGIILSVAMVSAIGTIIASTREALVKDAIRQNGSYHAGFTNISSETLEKIVNHVEVKESGASLYRGYGIVREATEEEKEMYGRNFSHRYLNIVSFEEKALDMLPYKIKEGRFPNTSDEIAIEYWMANYFENKVNLGDTIKLAIGQSILDDKGHEVKFDERGEKEYTVVGFTNPGYVWKGELITTGITGIDEEYFSEVGASIENKTISEEKTISKGKNGDYSVYIQLHNIKNANDKINAIANDVGLDSGNIKYNNQVLRLSAESLNDTFNSTIIALLLFFIVLIVVSTVAVIYNSFNISVLERVSQFGLLRSVGATPSQIIGIVLKEAFILSVIAIPIGLFSGVLAMKIVFYIISLLKFEAGFIRDMEISISLPVFLFSAAIGLITVFLSAIGPARKAGKVSPLEAVRNTGSLKKESFHKIKKSLFTFLIRKVLGVEGEIAFKNLRRNRKRFIITVFSMVISITLFITFASFSDFMFKANIIDNSNKGDYAIMMKDPEVTDKIYDEIRGVNDVKRVYKIRQMNGEMLIDDNKISKKIKEMAPNAFSTKKDNFVVVHNSNFMIIGDENFEVLKDSLITGSGNKEDLDKENGILVVNNTYVNNEKTNQYSLIEGYHLKQGDEIMFLPYDNEHSAEDENKKYNKLKVMGVLEKGVLNRGYNPDGSVIMITTEKVFNEISGLSHEENEKNNNDDDGNNGGKSDSSTSVNRTRIYTELYIEMEENYDDKDIKAYFEEKMRF